MTDKAHHSNRIRVSRIQLKLLPFWPADPQVFFKQVEAQFTIKDITAQKKRNDNVDTSLAPKFVMEVDDLICNLLKLLRMTNSN